jgi:hypothetical protein
MASAPDGRLWANVDTRKPVPETKGTHAWRPQSVPDPSNDADKLLLADDREYLRALTQPLRVEVDVGETVRSRELAQKLAKELQSRGFTIGPTGLALRVSHSVENTREELTFGGMGGKGRPIPSVRYAWQLISSEGKVAWQMVTYGYFFRQGSKYYSKTKREGLVPGAAGMSQMRTEYYDFGGRDMRMAIVEEILQGSGSVTLPPGAPPPFLVKAKGEYKPVPVASEIKLDPGP